MGVSTEQWQHFAHDADMGVRGVGRTVAAAFEQAALALVAVIADPATVRGQVRVMMQCAAPDLEYLLVEWLNTIVYEMGVRNLIFGRFRVHIDGSRLTAEAWGEAVDPVRHQPAAEVKGATLTALSVALGPDGLWRAACVVDV
ncbi:MAG: archease [Alphaproteobacteria bacterium]|nr:archease [Alphaproteobacteria bacterium]